MACIQCSTLRARSAARRLLEQRTTVRAYGATSLSLEVVTNHRSFEWFCQSCVTG